MVSAAPQPCALPAPRFSDLNFHFDSIFLARSAPLCPRICKQVSFPYSSCWTGADRTPSAQRRAAARPARASWDREENALQCLHRPIGTYLPILHSWNSHPSRKTKPHTARRHPQRHVLGAHSSPAAGALHRSGSPDSVPAAMRTRGRRLPRRTSVAGWPVPQVRGRGSGAFPLLTDYQWELCAP